MRSTIAIVAALVAVASAAAPKPKCTPYLVTFDSDFDSNPNGDDVPNPYMGLNYGDVTVTQLSDTQKPLLQPPSGDYVLQAGGLMSGTGVLTIAKATTVKYFDFFSLRFACATTLSNVAGLPEGCVIEFSGTTAAGRAVPAVRISYDGNPGDKKFATASLPGFTNLVTLTLKVISAGPNNGATGATTLLIDNVAYQTCK